MPEPAYQAAREQRTRRDDLDGSWVSALAELTERIRRLARAAALTEVDGDALRTVSETIAAATAALDERRRSGPLLGDFDQGRISVDNGRRIGATNTLVAPLEIEVDTYGAVARYHPDPLLEGAAGLLHGGTAAWLMDCMCGLLIEELDLTSRTANLTLDYRAPTPIDAELTLRSAIDRREGRKLWLRGSIEAAGRITVEASGLFIMLRS
ncbi:PaaI family thioesterase [Gordonia humi]|uniref:Acyl-coenzyme A thioesterase THEM4 n=1 Tax=Gordonia humi TaxID=686429 RepID=A0A840EW77_9ACTN|nr:PaaI family thioesterase [Gordonia humi]MBB4134086.1 acyl-coenzyme A thioesterase PaaI-like protein [Gordonia humi]